MHYIGTVGYMCHPPPSPLLPLFHSQLSGGRGSALDGDQQLDGHHEGHADGHRHNQHDDLLGPKLQSSLREWWQRRSEHTHMHVLPRGLTGPQGLLSPRFPHWSHCHCLLWLEER